MKARLFFLGVILLIMFIVIGLIYLLSEAKTSPAYKSNYLDTKDRNKELFQQPTTATNIPKTKEIHRENTWANQLTEHEVENLNNFVGTSQKISIQPLPNKGYKVSHQGKYRHSLVVQKNQDGSISKHEVGPNGIHDTHSSQTK